MATILIIESGSSSTELQSQLGPALRGKGHDVRVLREPPTPSQVESAGVVLFESPKDLGKAEALVGKLAGRDVACVIPIVPSGTADPRAACARLLRAGAADCLTAPLHVEEAVARIESRLSYKLYELELLSSSAVDLDTGAHSRWLFDKRLAEEHMKASRYPMPLAFLLVALDNVGDLRSRHGAEFVRTVLHEVALIIQGSLRATDFVARYGLAGFAVLLPYTSATDALVCAERIRGRTEVFPFRHESATGNATVSVGVAGYSPKRTPEPSALAREAQVCLAFAQKEGGNRVVADEEYVPRSAQGLPSYEHLIEDIRSGGELEQIKAYQSLREAGGRAAPALLEALHDSNPAVRRYCAWALGILAAKNAAPELVKLLKDSDRDVRSVVAWALGRIEDPEAVPDLIASVADEDAQVRAAAALSHSTLTGGSVKPNVTGTPEELKAECEKWRKFWADQKK
jgi:diguanylate cyclase (GGDEF)-like protein